MKRIILGIIFDRSVCVNYKLCTLLPSIIAGFLLRKENIDIRITNVNSDIKASQEIIEIENLVKHFGENLKNVSLLAPIDILRDSLKVYYEEFISPSLLEKWKLDPTNALGRFVSSPWPERIDIVSIVKISDYEYVVYGNIIEMTSEEMKYGGVANRVPIKLYIIDIDGKWLIDSFE